MEQINIYSGQEIVSRVIVGDDTVDANLDIFKTCLAPYSQVYALIDSNVVSNPFVAILYDFMQESNIPVKTIEVSEQSKSMEHVLEICQWLLDKGADRNALVISFGGGITSDLVGFSASIYKRGVRFAFVPTTLLAQVDASIGGKNGVNFDRYKNILGVIRQPEFVFVTPLVLETLPRRDFLSGVAEMLKTFIIEDNGNYQLACDCLKAEEIDYSTLGTLIAAAAKVKAGVVTRDAFESGERRKLNLGHTFAHAIETLAQRQVVDITHGEAVAIGMVIAAELAENMTAAGRFDAESGLVERFRADFKACGLKTECPFAIEDLAEAMSKDKKAEAGKVHFVLPRTVGDVVMQDLTVKEVVDFLI